MSSGSFHQTLAQGRWANFSLTEQLGHIGSEVNRTIRARGDQNRFDLTVNRTLELFDLTLCDPRWRKRLKEITRARELYCAAVYNISDYSTSLEDLDAYFFHFAMAARAQK